MIPETLLKPNVSEQLAIELARRLYGLEVTDIKRMVSFDDQNFHIKVTKEHKNPYISQISANGYTLKVTNTYKSSLEGNFDSMHTSMLHLDKKGMHTPVPVKNLEGQTWTLERVPLLNEDENLPGPKLCGVHLLTYISGVPVSTQEYTKDLLFQWGLLLAKFHYAVEDLDRLGFENKSVFWNLEHIPELRKYMEGLEGQRLKLLLSVLDRYPSEIEKNMDRLPKESNSYSTIVASTSIESNSYSTIDVIHIENIYITFQRSDFAEATTLLE
ncbi:aminoglycoside phosphotransferase domain-containing protein 1 [Caerostris darwini]|uniref:Aminoglycoside phosphotransferase domain-containing protein 1 n=1 Tax=Caerostris darwini TaxID=1538125 RepID=A0AAV4N9P9_9ARAC|nr:aminoglycoside phosphotransferase domain-containing protein 1 [Caerostris darwini]